jgi:hypothetical protein
MQHAEDAWLCWVVAPMRLQAGTNTAKSRSCRGKRLAAWRGTSTNTRFKDATEAAKVPVWEWLPQNHRAEYRCDPRRELFFVRGTALPPTAGSARSTAAAMIAAATASATSTPIRMMRLEDVSFPKSNPWKKNHHSPPTMSAKMRMKTKNPRIDTATPRGEQARAAQMRIGMMIYR